jgi:oligopeptide transport system ATP-binding protein
MALLKVTGLKTYFPIRTGILRRHTDDVRAVDDVSFTV